MSPEPAMTIGEVLSTLKEEFSDITVSKIRFLESEGLIQPERTPSGYRKFSRTDVNRLRFILKLQRDSYLPLKVIRERLEAADASGTVPEAASPPAAAAAPAEAPQGTAAAPAPRADADEEYIEPLTALHLTEADLAGAAGLDPGQVRQLKDFGVICEHSVNGGNYYDQDDLIVSRIARDFFKYGIEPRHLKMFRQFAERESALLEQVVVPLLHHRSPEARRQAANSLAEMTRLARKMRHAFLRRNLREYLTGADEEKT